MFFYFDWQVKLIIPYLEDFLSSAKPLLNPATMAGFSSYKKRQSPQALPLSLMFVFVCGLGSFRCKRIENEIITRFLGERTGNLSVKFCKSCISVKSQPYITDSAGQKANLKFLRFYSPITISPSVQTTVTPGSTEPPPTITSSWNWATVPL